MSRAASWLVLLDREQQTQNRFGHGRSGHDAELRGEGREEATRAWARSITGDRDGRKVGYSIADTTWSSVLVDGGSLKPQILPEHREPDQACRAVEQATGDPVVQVVAADADRDHDQHDHDAQDHRDLPWRDAWVVDVEVGS